MRVCYVFFLFVRFLLVEVLLNYVVRSQQILRIELYTLLGLMGHSNTPSHLILLPIFSYKTLPMLLNSDNVITLFSFSLHSIKISDVFFFVCSFGDLLEGFVYLFSSMTVLCCYFVVLTLGGKFLMNRIKTICTKICIQHTWQIYEIENLFCANE